MLQEINGHVACDRSTRGVLGKLPMVATVCGDQLHVDILQRRVPVDRAGDAPRIQGALVREADAGDGIGIRGVGRVWTGRDEARIQRYAKQRYRGGGTKQRQGIRYVRSDCEGALNGRWAGIRRQA